jgi:2-polyprenyl-6-methoxyphenol hydroxylase-like FAD-dependent oxidoreductase
MLLARRGHDVLVVDRADLPSDTLSTHSLARSGVVQLDRWGLLERVLGSGAPAIRTVAFHIGDDTIVRPIKHHAGVDLVVAPRRHVLDAILADAAMAAGATLRTGIHVQGTARADDGRVTGVWGRDSAGPVEMRARLVIGADGVRSRIARAVGAEVVDTRPSVAATHYAYHHAPSWTSTELFVGECALSGIFPTHDGQACIWTCLPRDEAVALRHDAADLGGAFDAMLRRAAPALADRLAATARASVVRGAVGLPNHVLRPCGPGWALVGDAGYHRDPITGHGLSDAFRDAELLADAVHAVLVDDVDEPTALAGYERTRHQMLQEIFELTCALAQFPPVDRFVGLQRSLSAAIDAEASALAGRPRSDALVTG